MPTPTAEQQHSRRPLTAELAVLDLFVLVDDVLNLLHHPGLHHLAGQEGSLLGIQDLTILLHTEQVRKACMGSMRSMRVGWQISII
jgi:hypothetical protein